MEDLQDCDDAMYRFMDTGFKAVWRAALRRYMGMELA